MREKNLAEHARDKTGPYDLSGNSTPSMAEMLVKLSASAHELERMHAADLALGVGDAVEWAEGDNKGKGYGVIGSIDTARGVAEIKPAEPTDGGFLSPLVGEANLVVALSNLKKSNLMLLDRAPATGNDPKTVPAPKGSSASLSADLSGDAGDDGDALLRWFRGHLDGSDARRRGLEHTKDAREEYLNYWRRQHAEGQPVPRDIEDDVLRGG